MDASDTPAPAPPSPTHLSVQTGRSETRRLSPLNPGSSEGETAAEAPETRGRSGRSPSPSQRHKRNLSIVNASLRRLSRSYKHGDEDEKPKTVLFPFPQGIPQSPISPLKEESAKSPHSIRDTVSFVSGIEDPKPLVPKQILVMSRSTPEFPKWSLSVPPVAKVSSSVGPSRAASAVTNPAVLALGSPLILPHSPLGSGVTAAVGAPMIPAISATKKADVPMPPLRHQSSLSGDSGNGRGDGFASVERKASNASGMSADKIRDFRSRTVSLNSEFRPLRTASPAPLIPPPKLAMPFTPHDMELFSSIVEKSRQAKNFNWKRNEPVTLFTNWQDEYYSNLTSNLVSPNRLSYPGSSTDSPLILPGSFSSNALNAAISASAGSLYTPTAPAPPPTAASALEMLRSPSPVFFAEEYDFDEDDAASYVSSTTSSSVRNSFRSTTAAGRWDSPILPASSTTSSSKGGYFGSAAAGARPMLRHRTMQVNTSTTQPTYGASSSPPNNSAFGVGGNSLASTPLDTPRHHPSTTSQQHPMVRSQSEGDLREYLRDFTEFHDNLAIAKVTCDVEIRRIVDELNEAVEVGLLAEDEVGERGRFFDGATSPGRGRSAGGVGGGVHSPPSMSRAGSFSKRKSALTPGNHSKQQSSLSISLEAPVTSSSEEDDGDDELEGVKRAGSSSLTGGGIRSLTPTSSKRNPPALIQNEPQVSILDPSQQQPFLISPLPSHQQLLPRVLNSGILSPPNILSPRQTHHRVLNPTASTYTLTDTSPHHPILPDLIALATEILDMQLDQLMDRFSCKRILGQLLRLQEGCGGRDAVSVAVMRLLIVFAAVARRVEHLEEDVKLWGYMSGGRKGSVAREAASPLVTGGGAGSVGSVNLVGAGTGVGKSYHGSPAVSLFGRIDAEIVAAELSDLEDAGTESDAGWSAAESGEVGVRRNRRRSSATPSSVGEQRMGRRGWGVGNQGYTPRVQVFNMPPEEQRKGKSGLDHAGNAADSAVMELRYAADSTQAVNILMEMSLEGVMTYISPAVEDVLGYTEKECLGASLESVEGGGSRVFLPPGCVDASAFKDATAALVGNEKITIEVMYKARTKDGRWMEMEGKGMIMYDRVTGAKKSTVWLIKPIRLIGESWDNIFDSVDDDFDITDFYGNNSDEENDADVDEFVSADGMSPVAKSYTEEPTDDVSLEDSQMRVSESGDSSGSSNSRLKTDLVLCRICERPIPALHFEAHHPSCLEVHQLENDIQLANESLEVRKTECQGKIAMLTDEHMHERADIVKNRKERRTSFGIPAASHLVQLLFKPHIHSPLGSSTLSLSDDMQRSYLNHIEKLIRISHKIFHVIEEALGVPVPDSMEDSVLVDSVASDLNTETSTSSSLSRASQSLPLTRDSVVASNPVNLNLPLPPPPASSGFILNPLRSRAKTAEPTPRPLARVSALSSSLRKLNQSEESLPLAAVAAQEPKSAVAVLKEWTCPDEIEFQPPESLTNAPPDSQAADSLCAGSESVGLEQTMDGAVIELGNGIYQLGTEVQTLVRSKMANYEKMRKALEVYKKLGEREEEAKLAIAIKTGTMPPIESVGFPVSNSLRKDSIFGISLRDVSMMDAVVSDGGGGSVRNSTSLTTRDTETATSSAKPPRTPTLLGSVLSKNLERRDSVESNVPEKLFFDMDLSSESGSESNLDAKSVGSMSKATSQRALSDFSPLNSMGRPSKRNRPPRVIVSANKALEVEMIHPTSQPSSVAPSPCVAAMPMHFAGLTQGASPAMSPMMGPSGLVRSAPSIKDFEIIKPISKGAFGSVYLAKKRLTGDYFAIKVLRKSDMIAKNQVTNIKAERMILGQLDSPYVVKLYFSFQTKDNLYLVMEYLNGGDCAALVKAVGSLDEKWAKQYISEVVLGVEFLHSKGIIHRDLKPDNMLIDQHGHIRLTDFGLSRVGFLGRRSKGGLLDNWGLNSPNPIVSPGASDPSSSTAAVQESAVVSPSSQTIPLPFSQQLLARSHGRRGSVSSISSSVDTGGSLLGGRLAESMENAVVKEKGFVGTPDYLAPESILGLGQDASVDWWAVGVILYEFLYGFPPFNAPTPAEVFSRILARKIEWHEDEVDISPEARDLMERLMCKSVEKRLGTMEGADEVKRHPFFADVDWSVITSTEASFVPKPANDEDTEYFDTRGASKSMLSEENLASLESLDTGEVKAALDGSDKKTLEAPKIPALARALSPKLGERRATLSGTAIPQRKENTDFGEFSYKNLALLEKENNAMVQMISLTRSNSSAGLRTNRRLSVATDSPLASANPLSADDASSAGRSVESTPTSSETSSPMSPSGKLLEKTKKRLIDVGTRRNSLPSRLRTKSLNTGDVAAPNSPKPPSPLNVPASSGAQSVGRASIGAHQAVTPSAGGEYLQTAKQALLLQGRSLSSSSSSGVVGPPPPLLHPLPPVLSSPNASISSSPSLLPSVPKLNPTLLLSTLTPPAAASKQSPVHLPALSALVADDNPVACKILETLLAKLNCRSVVVRNGAEAIRCAMGDLKFDVVFMDIRMPIIDGETAARMIKSTDNINRSTPIVAVTAYEQTQSLVQQFNDIVSKPVSKEALYRVLQAVSGTVTE
ncbi:hypothetical protein HDU98_000153 [Podochytrium sp. JEL0797]|nr:hypothetical protein HDU98_000153 [Podochytrium sp. JEL0797]